MISQPIHRLQQYQHLCPARFTPIEGALHPWSPTPMTGLACSCICIFPRNGVIHYVDFSYLAFEVHPSWCSLYQHFIPFHDWESVCCMATPPFHYLPIGLCFQVVFHLLCWVFIMFCYCFWWAHFLVVQPRVELSEELYAVSQGGWSIGLQQDLSVLLVISGGMRGFKKYVLYTGRYLVLCSDALLCFSNTALEVHWDPVLPLLHFMSLKKLSKAHSINICQDSPVAPSHPRLPLWGFW